MSTSPQNAYPPAVPAVPLTGVRPNVLHGKPASSVTIFPSPGLRDPASSQPKTRSEYDWSTTIGEQSFRIYTFDSDWEIVPGVWTQQLWYQGRMLAEQKFTVVKQ